MKLGNRTIEIQYSRLPEKRRATEIIILHDVTELVEVRQEIVEVRARAITAEAQAQAAVQLQELNEALKNAKDEALAASKAKSAFLANMSHELRTPLNAIIGFGEILKDETFGDLNKKQSRHISNVLQSGYHLLRLINDLLDIAKIEAGRVVLELEKVSLSTAVSQVVNVLEGLAAENKVSLKFNSPGELPVHADGARLNQILFNLINNGIKFSPNGVVEITLFEDGPATARVRVADTGRGLSREDLGRVFGRFEQVDPGRQEGTGLGLAITHKLVELHGGNIWVESDGPGKGCQFHFTLNRFL